jgi:hypothetical protein
MGRDPAVTMPATAPPPVTPSSVQVSSLPINCVAPTAVLNQQVAGSCVEHAPSIKHKPAGLLPKLPPRLLSIEDRIDVHTGML